MGFPRPSAFERPGTPTPEILEADTVPDEATLTLSTQLKIPALRTMSIVIECIAEHGTPLPPSYPKGLAQQQLSDLRSSEFQENPTAASHTEANASTLSALNSEWACTMEIISWRVLDGRSSKREYHATLFARGTGNMPICNRRTCNMMQRVVSTRARSRCECTQPTAIYVTTEKHTSILAHPNPMGNASIFNNLSTSAAGFQELMRIPVKPLASLAAAALRAVLVNPYLLPNVTCRNATWSQHGPGSRQLRVCWRLG